MIAELDKTVYADVSMTVLSSREQSCTRPFSAPVNKNEECLKWVGGAWRDGAGCWRTRRGAVRAATCTSACVTWPASLRAGRGTPPSASSLDARWCAAAPLTVQAHACPYFAARELVDGASLVFCPYNYLIDPLVRQQLGINLGGHVVILDEAHNIEVRLRAASDHDRTRRARLPASRCLWTSWPTWARGWAACPWRERGR